MVWSITTIRSSTLSIAGLNITILSIISQLNDTQHSNTKKILCTMTLRITTEPTIVEHLSYPQFEGRLALPANKKIG